MSRSAIWSACPRCRAPNGTEFRARKLPIDAEDVGAWLFKPSKRPQGSIVEEVELDPETGLFATDYDSVSETLYNESAAIYNRSKGSSA